MECHDWCAEVLAKQEKEKNRLKCKRWRARKVASGACTRCGSGFMARGTSGTCYKCTLQRMAHGVLGNSRKWVVLAQKLVAQRGRCAYTGRKLSVGINASPDHMLPVARFKELARDDSNIIMVDTQVNMAKRDLTDGEFLGLCCDVVLWYIKGEKWKENLQHGDAAARVAVACLVEHASRVCCADIKSAPSQDTNQDIDTKR